MSPPTPAPARHSSDYTPGSPNRLTHCRLEECDREHKAQGLCNAHYQRWQRYGDVLAHIPVTARGVSGWLQWRCEPDETAIERAMSGDAPDVLLLPERHAAIARLTQRGLSAKQIAERLGCTERTVQRHRSRLRMAEKRSAVFAGSVSAVDYTESVPERAAS